jgi:spoIIIJ-associated protein
MIVDSEGYRQRRVEALQGMAHRTARRALREKRSLSLPPMSAAERRVIHLYLKENSHVTTSSEGQEEDRRVVVSPL